MQNEHDVQAAVIAFLADPATHCGKPVERADTHISHIFLVGDRAYKLKRAVTTNFLDFSTRERREAACRREIEVNRGIAEAIYLGVQPIVRRGGHLALGGAGEVMDWVVEMQRFDRDTEFDRLAERQELTTDLVETLADTVARMHVIAPATSDFGGPGRVGATIAQIADAIADAPGSRPPSESVAAWRAKARAHLATGSRKLEVRRRHGCVRRCHGDLHLGNICLIDGKPTPFDALEFNEEMASTDVLYDIAFTLMDLQERGLRQHAATFLSRYLAANRDYSGLSLLPLFISMRAAVRALVAASRRTPDPHEPNAAERLAFAIESLEADRRPALIAIGGLSGSGKSTLARRIAPDLGTGTGAIVLRSDVARKRLFGVSPEGRLHAAAYDRDVSLRLYRQMLRDSGRALRAGAAVILDATFLSIDQRAQARALAERQNTPFLGLWLDCPAEVLRCRVASRANDASDADLAVLNRQLEHDPGPGDWLAVPAGGTIEEALAALRLRLRNL